jgi:purine-nucleoside/S-methyl-5'-thioadenosine phosphorylase / adenosine deaminase
MLDGAASPTLALPTLPLDDSCVLIIDDIGVDTYSDERCFSYRRSVHRGEPDYGRHVHALALEAE